MVISKPIIWVYTNHSEIYCLKNHFSLNSQCPWAIYILWQFLLNHLYASYFWQWLLKCKFLQRQIHFSSSLYPSKSQCFSQWVLSRWVNFDCILLEIIFLELENFLKNVYHGSKEINVIWLKKYFVKTKNPTES